MPAKVAINEAIELAKTFGGESSGRFVNGVLGAVYKEMGEPGKDEVSKKKIKDIPYEKMPIEKLGGSVVYAKDKKDIYLALVHDVFGHWTLSKGRIDEGEDVEKTTMRKIKEELGVNIKIKEKLGENEYIANDPEIGKKRKQVNYFLGEAKYEKLTLGSSGGLDDAKWFKLEDIADLNFYDDILPLVTKAVNILLKNRKAIFRIMNNESRIMNIFNTFENKIGIIFKNKNLLMQAFLHRSYLNENKGLKMDHNERLEFLGDAVLELVVTEYLYAKYPKKTEGDLTSYRAALVNTATLSNVAGELEMNDFLLLSKGEAKDTGRARQYILANTFESFVGALYLDQGYDALKNFIAKNLFPFTDEIVVKGLGQDAKSSFQ